MSLQGNWRTLAIALGLLPGVASFAQIDPDKRQLLQLGYNASFEGHAPLAAYAFYYLNRPDFYREDLTLRIFLDKNVIEAFANDRQAIVASQKFAPGNLGIRLFSRGGNVVVKEVKCWRMKSIYSGQ